MKILAKLSLLTVVAALAATPVRAQVETREGIFLQNQIQELKRDIQTLRDQLRAAGVIPKAGAPAEITKMLETRIPQWADVINSAKIRID